MTSTPTCFVNTSYIVIKRTFYHLDTPCAALHLTLPGWWQKGSVCQGFYWLLCSGRASEWICALPPPPVVLSRYCWPHHPAASWCLTLEEDRETQRWCWWMELRGICHWYFKLILIILLLAYPGCSVCWWISQDLGGSLCHHRGIWTLPLPQWPLRVQQETPSETHRCPTRRGKWNTRLQHKDLPIPCTYVPVIN